MSQEGYLRVSGRDESHFRNVGTGLPDEDNDDDIDGVFVCQKLNDLFR